MSDHIKGAAQSSVSAYLGAELDEHAALVAKIREAVADEFVRLVSVCSTALRAGNKLLFFGNGGSAADAQHLATELVVRYKANRPALAAMALTTDTSALTAIGNDFGFDALFARQLEALCRAGDIAIRNNLSAGCSISWCRIKRTGASSCRRPRSSACLKRRS